MLLPANPGCLQAGISQDLRFKVPAVSAALTQPEAHISQLLNTKISLLHRNSRMRSAAQSFPRIPWWVLVSHSRSDGIPLW